MFVALETLVTCPAPGCGYKIRFLAFATVRVNKRSLRITGGGTVLGAFEDWKCPGCREVIPRDRPLDREPYKLSDEDAVKVREYRRKRWGIEDPEGVPVEVVPSETAATRRQG